MLTSSSTAFEDVRTGRRISGFGRALACRGHDVSGSGDYGQPDGANYAGVKTIKAFREREGLPVFRYVYRRWIKL